MDARLELFRKIQIYGFNIADTALYLDTHPMDPLALDYYARIRDLNRKAIAEYTSSYGPITMDDVNVDNKWTWIEHPWPWETEA